MCYYCVLYLTHQGQITHNVPWTLKCMCSSNMHGILTLVVRFPRAKTLKVCGVTNVLSLDLSSEAG